MASLPKGVQKWLTILTLSPFIHYKFINDPKQAIVHQTGLDMDGTNWAHNATPEHTSKRFH